MALLLKFDLSALSLVLVLTAVIASFTLALFNLTKHPLSRFPGPSLWACSRIPYILSLQNGTLPMKVKALHDIYGPVVRVAPNELSFISPEAWENIYSGKTSALERGAIFYGVLGQNTFLGAGNEAHARMRRLLSPAFRSSAVRSYEENMRRYLHLLVERLGLLDKSKACEEKPDTVGRPEVTVDIVRWLNFITFDIAGNFVYGGDPFGCLRSSEFHPWVELICTWVKVSAISFSVRFYPPLDRVLMWLVPPSLRKQKEEFDRLGRDCLQKRMLRIDDKADDGGFENEEGYRGALPRDLLTSLMSSKQDEGIMTMAEMEVNLPLLVIGGSETIATTLSGTINYLCQNAAVLRTLTEEVRTAVPHGEGLTLAKLSKLPYLTGVLKEGLRIVSPGPVSLPRIVPAEGISIDGYWVPGHNIVAVNSFAAARSATNFYQPLTFLPERWLDSAATSPSSPFASDKRNASKHFGGGARDCLGKKIAWAEMRLIIAGLVWAFDIEAVRALEWTRQKAYVVWEKEPFEVRLRRRVE